MHGATLHTRRDAFSASDRGGWTQTPAEREVSDARRTGAGVRRTHQTLRSGLGGRRSLGPHRAGSGHGLPRSQRGRQDDLAAHAPRTRAPHVGQGDHRGPVLRRARLPAADGGRGARGVELPPRPFRREPPQGLRARRGPAHVPHRSRAGARRPGRRGRTPRRRLLARHAPAPRTRHGPAGRPGRPRARRTVERPRPGGHPLDALAPAPPRRRGTHGAHLVAPARRGAADRRRAADHLARPPGLPGRHRRPRRPRRIRDCGRLPRPRGAVAAARRARHRPPAAAQRLHDPSPRAGRDRRPGRRLRHRAVEPAEQGREPRRHLPRTRQRSARARERGRSGTGSGRRRGPGGRADDGCRDPADTRTDGVRRGAGVDRRADGPARRRGSRGRRAPPLDGPRRRDRPRRDPGTPAARESSPAPDARDAGPRPSYAVASTGVIDIVPGGAVPAGAAPDEEQRDEARPDHHARAEQEVSR